MIITSKDNESVKEIKKLKQKKYRENKFIVEGIKMVKEAISEKQEIECLVLREGTILDFDATNYKVLELSEKVFNDLTDVVSPQGVLAVIRKHNDVLKTIDTSADYILALDGIQDPGNLGTILRTADSINLKQIIVSKNTVDAYSDKVIRSTMGAIYRVEIIEVDNLAEKIIELQNKGFEAVVTSLQTQKSIYDLDYKKKIVVIGNEANGVSNEVCDIADYKVKIPMKGKTESLNASVAAGIMMYEYVRQNIK